MSGADAGKRGSREGRTYRIGSGTFHSLPASPLPRFPA